jgi:hypothetical protein
MRNSTTPHPVLADSTIPEFCERHRWSRSFFYKQVAAGRGPRVTKDGRKSTITGEDELAWVRSRHHEAAE